MLDSARPWEATVSEKAARPALSLILCSRNDKYMGNSCWRLETTLNYVAKQIEALGRTNDVELLVTDWGSEVPLREVLRLTPAAAALVSFILVPPDVARLVQKDSPFPEVLALNAAARRAQGQFVGRIDQDTLVGRRFLEVFFDLCEGRRQLDVPLDSALLFSNVRMVPYRFTVRTPSFADVEQFVKQFGGRFKIELTSHKPFYRHSIGIWLLPRQVWHECGGYHEEMLYMNTMEYDMMDRLMPRYEIVNLGALTDYDFYHLEHYHPWVPRKSGIHRKVNSHYEPVFYPNDENWGLNNYGLQIIPCLYGRAVSSSQHGLRPGDNVRFSFLMLLVKAQIACDGVVRGVLGVMGRRWHIRAGKAWIATQSEPVHRWIPKLFERWRNRNRPI